MRSFKIVLIISIVLNLVLIGVIINSVNSGDTDNERMSAEQSSGINNFDLNAECNVVHGYEVCKSDFMGLELSEAERLAKIHGLSSDVNRKDGEQVWLNLTQEPLHVSFNIEYNKVTGVGW